MTTSSERRIVIKEEREAALEWAANEWLSLARQAIEERGAFYVALSGGSTPRAIYERVAKPDALDWSRVWLFWGDERTVPPNDPSSNFRMAMEAGFSLVGIPEEQIIRLEGERKPHEAAAAYQKAIERLVPAATFDLIMLGMGDDGHTASLFPGTTALDEGRLWVVANEVPQLRCHRLTATYPLFARARRVIVYVLGEGKAEMVARILEGEESLPVQRIAKATWLLDAASASRLSAHLH